MVRERFAELTLSRRGRGEFALRLAVICTITTWVAEGYQIPDVALSAYVVFFMLRPDRVGSVVTSVVLWLLLTIIIGYLLIVATDSLDYPPLRVAIMAGTSLTMMFLASASKLKPFASAIALIVAYGLDAIARAPGGEPATRALLFVWLLISVPAGLTVAVNLVAGPAPRRLAQRDMADRLRAAQTLLTGSSAVARVAVATLRRTGGTNALNLLHMALIEKITPSADLRALRQAARSTEVLLMLAEAIDGHPETPQVWRQAAAARLGEMAAILDRGLYPVGIGSFASPVPCTGPLALLIADFDAVLAGFAEKAPAPGGSTIKAKTGFFLLDAFSNPEHVRYAIKVTIAAMGCYLFYSMTDWQGIHTCLITCYIVALDTTAETVEKLSLRLIGAVIGAAAGVAALIWVLPSIDRIGGLLALVFMVSLVGGWIVSSGPRLAYSGFQLTFAFLLCVIQGSGPAYDLTVARDRVIGILIGDAAIYLMFVSVWPRSVARNIDAAIADMFAGLARIARLPDHPSRRDALAAAHSAVAQVTTDLDIATFEPAHMRPDTEWFDRRGEMLASLESTESTLLLSEDDKQLEGEARKLDEAAEAIHRGDARLAPIPGGSQLEHTFAH
ncbi:FUSC family protein [Sphingomonas sp. NFX23]|uniref:FUSC family protein n=1 Tax=Sphingomonas sp. NFX23 TaxID=2819532 RepID=UPI003CF2E4EA